MPSRWLSGTPCSRLKCRCSPSIRLVCRRSALSLHLGRSVVLASVVAVALTVAIGPVHAQSTAVLRLFGAAPADPLASSIAEASRRFRIPAAWIRAVIHVESAGETNALSPKGAMGLMQIMPNTWAGLCKRYGLGTDPYDPHANIMAGAAYLRELLDRYGTAGFLAAYNAGPARWEDHLARGRPLPAQTYAYLAQLALILDNRGSHFPITLTSVASSRNAVSLFTAQRSGLPANKTTALLSPARDRSNALSVMHWAMLAPTAQRLFVALPKTGPSQ